MAMEGVFEFLYCNMEAFALSKWDLLQRCDSVSLCYKIRPILGHDLLRLQCSFHRDVLRPLMPLHCCPLKHNNELLCRVIVLVPLNQLRLPTPTNAINGLPNKPYRFDHKMEP
ncbi:hypothetical protein CIPAW_05G061500 [Carya illinoinensis]|uniref:Uncharacterized protein n=1 Tax=Carya illinoinensis TaxID=32201 RepID=A0A8T1QFV9_CARIL|nr:hypothetical protein CIPAW_05G061500 [Carya illinoinensis]